MNDDNDISDDIIYNLVPAREAVMAMLEARKFSKQKLLGLIRSLNIDIMQAARDGKSELRFIAEKQYGYKLHELIKSNSAHLFYKITCDDHVYDSDPGDKPCNFIISWSCNG